MNSLKQQLIGLKAGRIILWLTHADLKTMNGVLAATEEEHIEVLVDNHTYFIPYTAIAAVRAA